MVIEMSHHVELLQTWLTRVREWGTFPHLIVPAFVVDQDGRPVPLEERLELLRGIPEVDEETIAEVAIHEPDVWTFHETLEKPGLG